MYVIFKNYLIIIMEFLKITYLYNYLCNVKQSHKQCSFSGTYIRCK